MEEAVSFNNATKHKIDKKMKIEYACSVRLCMHCELPAVDYDRSGIWNGVLSSVNLFQKVQNSPWFIGHTVIRPAQVLIVPDISGSLLLQLYQDQTNIQ